MYLVFNTGGTNTRISVSEDGDSLEEIVAVKTPDDAIGGCRLIWETGRKLAAGREITEIAGGIAGTWDKQKKELMRSPNLPGWEGKIEFPIEKVSLENDAALEGLGEAVKGAGKGHDLVAYLCIGTGIGGSRIVKGRIDNREWGFEPGHIIICWKESVDYLENFASGRAMEKIWGRKAEVIEDEEAWRSETQLIAIGLHNLNMMWSPEIIVLGGSVSQRLDIEEIKVQMGQMREMFPKLPEMVKAELGDKSGLIGALELIKQNSTL